MNNAEARALKEQARSATIIQCVGTLCFAAIFREPVVLCLLPASIGSMIDACRRIDKIKKGIL